MNSPRHISGLAKLSGTFDLFLIDQFGVLHDGVQPYEGAIECLMRLKEIGRTTILLTNSGKNIAANEARLAGLGIPRDLFSHVVTSGEVARHGILKTIWGEPFTLENRAFIIGREEDGDSFREFGLTLSNRSDEADFIIFAGSNAPRTSLTQYREMLLPAVAGAIPALCCNPDRLMITHQGLQPSAGEIANIYAELGGKVIFVGKPHPEIYSLAKSLSLNRTIEKTLVIGDSLEHDICGGRDAGFATALVRTGIGSSLSEQQLDEAMHHFAAFPDYILPGLRW